MKKLLMFFAVVCLVTTFVSSAIARDKMVDLLVKKGVVTEEEIATLEAETGKTAILTGSNDIAIGGYVQPQYRWVDGDANVDDTFQLRRVYFYVVGYVFPQWRVCFSYDFKPEAVIDAWVTYEYASWLNVTAGQSLLPLCLEQMTSGSATDTIERAMISNSLPHRDIGVKVHGSAMDGILGYGVAIVNGNGINTTDDNDKKDIIGRIQVQPFLGSEGPMAGLLFAGAYQTGEQPWIVSTVDATGASIDTDMGDDKRTRYLGTLVWKYDGFKVQAEYAQAELEDSGVTSDGYYVLCTYDFPIDNMIVEPVVKYEDFDPNDDVTDDETTVITIGANLHFNGVKHLTKLQVNYRLIDEEPEVDNNELIVQWQHRW